MRKLTIRVLNACLLVSVFVLVMLVTMRVLYSMVATLNAAPWQTYANMAYWITVWIFVFGWLIYVAVED